MTVTRGPGTMWIKPVTGEDGESGWSLLGHTSPDPGWTIPAPIRGGTFHYCPWSQPIPGGVEVCGVRKAGWATGTRFRTARAYRRHYRRHHVH